MFKKNPAGRRGLKGKNLVFLKKLHKTKAKPNQPRVLLILNDEGDPIESLPASIEESYQWAISRFCQKYLLSPPQPIPQLRPVK